MVPNKDIIERLNLLKGYNTQIAEIYETKRGNVQMEGYGESLSWRAYLNYQGLPVLAVEQDSMDGEPYVIITFGYPEPAKESELTVDSVVNRQRAWKAKPEDERSIAAFNFDEMLKIIESYVGLFEDSR